MLVGLNKYVLGPVGGTTQTRVLRVAGQRLRPGREVSKFGFDPQLEFK